MSLLGVITVIGVIKALFKEFNFVQETIHSQSVSVKTNRNSKERMTTSYICVCICPLNHLNFKEMK
jgi:hypothetical protein